MTESRGDVVERKGLRQMLLNMETRDPHGGLAKAIERSKQGLGTAVFCSHNMMNDMLGALIMLKKIPEFSGKEFVLPMNSMLYKRYKYAEKLMGVTFLPVHSPEVKRKHALAKNKTTLRELSLMDRILVPKDETLDSETPLTRYLEASKRALEHGGIVLVAPQAQGNLDKIDLTHQRKAFSRFWNYMNTDPNLHYSIVPMGVSYPRLLETGRPQKGSHFGERMRIEVGTCYDSADIPQEIRAHDGNADLWIYSQIASLMPAQAVKTVFVGSGSASAR